VTAVFLLLMLGLGPATQVKTFTSEAACNQEAQRMTEAARLATQQTPDANVIVIFICREAK